MCIVQLLSAELCVIKLRLQILTCYLSKIALNAFSEYLLYDRCLFCIKGHETSALLILEKITDRNLINATNAALQTYVSAVSVFYRQVFGVYPAHKKEYFSKLFLNFNFNCLIGTKSLTDLSDTVFCL